MGDGKGVTVAVPSPPYTAGIAETNRGTLRSGKNRTTLPFPDAPDTRGDTWERAAEVYQTAIWHART